MLYDDGGGWSKRAETSNDFVKQDTKRPSLIQTGCTLNNKQRGKIQETKLPNLCSPGKRPLKRCVHDLNWLTGKTIIKRCGSYFSVSLLIMGRRGL